MDLGLKGKVVVVTGASKGIGLAIARELVQEGAKIAICSTNEERIRAAAEELQAMGGEVYYDVADFCQEESAYQFGRNVMAHYGVIDSWVNNVGAQYTKGDDEEVYSNELLERCFAIIFKSAAFGCQAAYLAMKDRGGSIVNISSLGARCPTIGKATIYGPLKAAVNQLTMTLAGEYAAYGIRVNCVMPGYTMTEFNTANTTKETMEAVCAGTMMNRPGRVEEIAKPVVFLCGSGSTFMTGETVEVSGGRGLSLNPHFSYSEKTRKECSEKPAAKEH